ncbi:hypothetical protein [Streptomyces sp. NPDC058155]|uniref:hypothetical protein n=1 Tax=Streptomyces sp. NPDC058155 TaxID=3346359 RepID=UPI0036EA2DB4
MSSLTDQTAARDFLAAVLEGLDIPHPATIGGSEAHAKVLADRVMHTVIALRSALDGCPLGIEWTTEYLRERLAECPPAGYVSSEQARAGLAAGKTWSEAVALPAGEGR